METVSVFENDDDLNLKATELRLGLPGTHHETTTMEEHTLSSVRNNKRPSPDTGDDCRCTGKSDAGCEEVALAAKAQIVGWPPIRSYRKNSLQLHQQQQQKKKTDEAADGGPGIYVKVSMDGAPYL